MFKPILQRFSNNQQSGCVLVAARDDYYQFISSKHTHVVSSR